MTERLMVMAVAALFVCAAEAKEWPGFSRGMGIGGWLTNYKRFNVLPVEKRLTLTDGDFAHFDTYITEGDVARIRRWGFDHIRLGFDQVVASWRSQTGRAWESPSVLQTGERQSVEFARSCPLSRGRTARVEGRADAGCAGVLGPFAGRVLLCLEMKG